MLDSIRRKYTDPGTAAFDPNQGTDLRKQDTEEKTRLGEEET